MLIPPYLLLIMWIDLNAEYWSKIKMCFSFLATMTFILFKQFS